MLVRKKDWEESQEAIDSLLIVCSRLEYQSGILIGLCKDLSVQIAGQSVKIDEPVNETIVDKDGMFNFQKYKKHRKETLAEEGE